jgi:hypothetical protein
VTDEIEDQDSEETEEETSESESEALIDILSGEPITASPKNSLVQKVVRQLLESYGFDRADVKVGYRLTTVGKRGKSVDIAIVRHDQEPRDENIERVVVCQPQKVREKLRSPDEAVADLRKLQEKLDLLPACHLGLWTNGHEDFFVRAVDTTFETRFTNIGAWPAPGERTDEIFREGGATQVPADPEGLEATLRRCHQYLTKNRLLGADAFKPLGALLLAKLYDETRARNDRQFWIRGDEPFTAAGQEAIRQRVTACFEAATSWHSDVLLHGWDLGYLNAAQLARVVTEIAPYSLAESLPLSRTLAFRSGASSTMDGKEGRYPNPDRVGCPPREVLITLARRQRPLGDPAYEHLKQCSPCYLEGRAIQEADALHSRRRIVTWAAAAVLILATGTGAWLLGRGGGTADAEIRTQLDLRPYAITRGETQPTGLPALMLPRGRVMLTLLLPTGSEPGPYDVEITGVSTTPKVVARGNAELRNQVTTLEASLDLGQLPAGAYELAVRRDGDEWQQFPLRLQ